jgi:hypothetical protein
MQPYDFTMKTQPNDAIMGGIQNAFSINQMMQQRDARQLQMQQAEQQMREQEQQMRMKEQQAAQDAYKRQRMQQVMTNPNSKAVLGLGIEFPELGKVFTDISANMQQSEKDSSIRIMQPLYLALKAGKPDAAVKIAESNIEAAKNAGDEKAVQSLNALRDSIIADPNVGKFLLTGTLAAAMGGKEFADFDKTTGEEARAQELQPFKVTQESAKAQADAVRARFAESDAVIDLEKKGWDIKKIQSDMQIAKMNSQIAAMNAQTSRMSAGIAAQGNSLKQQENELKLQEMISKRDSMVREKAAEAEAGRVNIDNMLNTIDRVNKNPKLNSVLGTVQGRMPVLLSDQAQDAVALIDTLGSQAFLSQIPQIKGTGSLSTTEGDKLQAAFQNFTRVQSEKQFRESLAEANRLLLKARTNISKRTGLPDTVPDTPAAASSGNDIEALLRKYGQ